MYPSLDHTPVNTLGCPLSPFFRILIYFFLPPLLSFVVYSTLIVTDLSLVYYHFSEENISWGAATLVLMFIPSIAGSIFELSSRDRWPSYNSDKSTCKFIVLNLWHIVGFPFAAFYRYLHQIFWSIEAMSGHFAENVERTENSLRILLKPNFLELYFFLQSYLHSAPQILLQFHIIFTYSDTNHELFSIQILSIMMSIMRMATTTMSYQRFERRKVLGVHYPWIPKQALLNSKRFSTATTEKSAISEVCSTREPSIKQNFLAEPIEPTTLNFSDDDDEAFEEPRKINDATQIDPSHNEDVKSDIVMRRDADPTGAPKISSSSTIYEEPISFYDHSKISRVVSIVEDPEIEQKRLSRMESGKRSYVIEDMSMHITPPSTPAPRPASLAFIKGKIMTNAEHIAEMIPQRRHREDVNLPVRIRRQVIKGVEQEDGVAKMIAFIAWFLFIGARMLVLSSFSAFYLLPCVYICLSHYLLVTFLLLCNSWSEKWRRKLFYLFLGYVYTFCLIEFKMKFRRVRLWYGVFFPLVLIENFILTSVWYWTGVFNNWWYDYIVLLIVGSSAMSLICFVIYILLLKPKRVTRYPAVSLFSVSPVSI